MKLKNIAYAAFIAAAAAAFVIGSSGVSEAKKTAAAPPDPGPCFMMGEPVCGAKGGMKFTYANSCYAVRDGASVVSKGACHAPKAHKKHMKAKKAAKPAKKMEKKMEKKSDMKKPAKKDEKMKM